MKNDKKIREKVVEINQACTNFVDYVVNFNECAFSDRMIEKILEKANELKKLHQENK